jgi:hypothetical protein
MYLICLLCLELLKYPHRLGLRSESHIEGSIRSSSGLIGLKGWPGGSGWTGEAQFKRSKSVDGAEAIDSRSKDE